jgi:hypothetical protein
MKKFISIFFLFSFFLFQYGKMLDYMECRIVAAIESKTDCGCDSKLSAASQENKNPQPLHQHQLKNYTEEFFNHSEYDKTDLFQPISVTPVSIYFNHYSFAFTGFVFQPPC